MNEPVPMLRYEEIKDKYFYRTARWDWLDDKMIHVFDNNQPRIITMDPWPQEIFLDAVGDKTVKEYMQEFYYRYPEGQAPKDLNDAILEALSGLVLDEKLVTLTDGPIKLDELLLKPMRDQSEVDMIGTWKGFYTYGIPGEDGSTHKSEFAITITDVQGNKFFGTVEDDVTTGGTPGIGRISGTFSDVGIEFNKDMPVYAYVDKDGKRHNDSDKKHPTILYSGAFSSMKRRVTGVWKFKKKVMIWQGILPRWVTPGWGNFRMEKAG